ncbi:MAG TPA: BolA family transcriptional regulator [Deltaproteobacteria bacterium]|nr:MAG: transcriptional regulator BolA [Deltaproteobacteria bacterium GWA2_45_12]HBF13823.1 BolA family transcriptional regulator [Deltaproteobacteria bacterium]
MPIQSHIESLLQKSLVPIYLEVINESHQHSVPKNSETHFKIVIVSDQFNNLSFVQRQRKINELLKEFMGNPIHALTMGTYTVLEWNQKGKQAKPSPPCLGGSKKS